MFPILDKQKTTIKFRAFGTHFFGRTQGREMLDRLFALAVSPVAKGDVTQIDLEGVAFFDYTFADEAFARLAQRLSSENPERFLTICAPRGDIGSALIENIDIALDRRGLNVFVQQGEQDVFAVGAPLQCHLKQTLAVLQKHGEASACDVSIELEIPRHVASQRLYVMRGKRLVRLREEPAPGGGRRDIFSPIS